MVNQKTLMKVAGVIPFLFIRQSALSPCLASSLLGLGGIRAQASGFLGSCFAGLGVEGLLVILRGSEFVG